MDAGRADSSGQVTALLRASREGDDGALNQLVPLVYDELRRIARRQLRRELPGHTLSATALVHESYARLVGRATSSAVDRAHFLAIAARSMRQVLIDHARRRSAQRRGGDWQATTLTDGPRSIQMDPAELLALDDALQRLDPRQRQVVECRYFGGMDESETAVALGVSERTVRRDWVKARAWLYSVLYADSGESAP